VNQLRVVTVGNVDHGKSTLIGRLLHDTGNLPDGKFAELEASSARRGVPFEWSFVLDALQSERDQAITIDTTRIWMKLPGREVVLIDAPGHEEFVRNMVTGASDADAALLVVDAHEGVGDQTRRHALLLELIGVRRVAVAINKMDRVAYDRARYDAIRVELQGVLQHLGIVPVAIVPIVAREGDNLARRASSMPWYDGPTIAEALQRFAPIEREAKLEFRMAVQGVVRRDLERIVVGRVEAGRLATGDEVVFSPGARRAHVKAFAVWPEVAKSSAGMGESVGFTVDENLFLERGDVASDPASIPAAARRFRVRMLWLGRRELRARDRLRMRVGTRVATVDVERFERVVDMATLDPGEATVARANDVAEVVLRSQEPLALDAVSRHQGLGRFILLDGLDVVAGGTVLEVLYATNVVPAGHLLGAEARAWRNGHKGLVVWLTGPPAAGKSTLAMRLERALFERGVQTYVLDGDNVRGGLNRDLGFTDDDRYENVRRAGEVAALFADAGFVAIAALVSPQRDARALARAAASAVRGGGFAEIHVTAPEDVREARDPKGHYAQARAGAMAGFTGVSGRYEAPASADLTLDTSRLGIEEALATLLRFVRARIELERDPLEAI